MGHCPQRQVGSLYLARAEERSELGAEAYPSVGELGQQGRDGEAAEAASLAIANGGDDDGAEFLGGACGIVAGAEGFDQGFRKARADKASDLGIAGNGGGAKMRECEEKRVSDNRERRRKGRDKKKTEEEFP